MKLQSMTSARMLLFAGLAVQACSSAEGDDATADSTATANETFARVVNVEASAVQLTSFTNYIRLTGEAGADSEVTLSAEEAGAVERFHVEKGDRVEEGQVIATLNADVLRAQVDEARASASLAGEQFERQRRLWEDEGIGSEISFLQAKYNAEIAQARLATLESRLGKMTIRAPLAGVFDDKEVEVGELVLPGSGLGRVVAVDRIKIAAGVPERFAPDVRVGRRAVIVFEIFPQRTFQGTIDYVGTSVDPSNRTFLIEVVMNNPAGLVKPRMVANLQLVRSSLDDVIVVEQQIVVRREDGYQVYVIVERDGALIAEARSVRLGASSGSLVVIEDGLEPGDQLVTAGAQLVDDGVRVRIVGTDAPEA